MTSSTKLYEQRDQHDQLCTFKYYDSLDSYDCFNKNLD